MEAGGGCGGVQGEEQKKLDVITNRVLKQALRFTGRLSVIASEEEDVPVWLGDEKFDQNSDNLRTSDVVVEEGNKVGARGVASSRQPAAHWPGCSAWWDAAAAVCGRVRPSGRLQQRGRLGES